MARSAIILLDGRPTETQFRLGRVLDFFGVPWEMVEVSRLADIEMGTREHAVLGSARAVATALKQEHRATRTSSRADAYYAYLNDDQRGNEQDLRFLCEDSELSLRQGSTGTVSVRVSRQLANEAGPMAGLAVSLRLRREDVVVVGSVDRPDSRTDTIISAEDAPLFIRFQRNGVPVFFCASSYMVDIEQTVGPGFYDVKDHFCSVVPLVMFIRRTFEDVAWRPQELGACLIVDDPLLKHRYGYCDFENLRDLMQQHGFTTNIAFIPWNWRRTSSVDSSFFRSESRRFSVSIHGCDHIGDEFGTTSFQSLDDKAKLAQLRMRNHEARTGIHHDPVMVFPQGVFSSVCPEVLKHNGFLAAVNTETIPVDGQLVRTRIRDVWDIAIRTYGDFPIFTRRYAYHGLENFAFDLLLGKPCLIVSHHEFFKNDGSEVIELIEKLRSLNCCLSWRPLGDVIRRACRRRASSAGVEEVEMYGNELLIDNPSEREVELRVHKRETEPDLVAEVLSDGGPVTWTTESDQLAFGERILPHGQKRLQVVYRESGNPAKIARSLRFELSVAVRRILCELRDDYVSRSRLLSITAASLRSAVTRVS